MGSKREVRSMEKVVITTLVTRLANNAVIKFSNFRFINTEATKTEVAKPQFVSPKFIYES